MFNFKYNSKIIYDPGKLFGGYFKQKLGQNIWNFLMEEIVVFRMVCFSDAKRPAVEGIDEEFDNVFGKLLPAKQNEKDKIKQMTGHMIRQIMEGHGLNLDVQGIKIRKSRVFTVASRYKR